MTKRECIIIDSSQSHSRYLCVDLKIQKEFFDFINEDQNHRAKFKQIRDHILEERNIYFENYGKEGFNSQTRHVTAMKFFKGGKNVRVYCVEVKTSKGAFYVVAAHFLGKKKVQQNDNQIREIVKRISKYEYEIE